MLWVSWKSGFVFELTPNEAEELFSTAPLCWFSLKWNEGALR